MTYEQAYYHKLMLEIGITDDFDAALDSMLEQEDPLSNLALSLSTCGGGRNQQIHVLNEYLLDVTPEQLDRQTVFSYVVDKFRSIYESEPDQLVQITKWMYSVAWSSGWWMDDPWRTLSLMNDYYDFISDGLISKDSFMECFFQLIYKKTASSPLSSRSSQKKPKSFFLRKARRFSPDVTLAFLKCDVCDSIKMVNLSQKEKPPYGGFSFWWNEVFRLHGTLHFTLRLKPQYFTCP